MNSLVFGYLVDTFSARAYQTFRIRGKWDRKYGASSLAGAALFYMVMGLYFMGQGVLVASSAGIWMGGGMLLAGAVAFVAFRRLHRWYNQT